MLRPAEPRSGCSVALVMVAALCGQVSAGEAIVGVPAHDFRLTDTAGHEFGLAELKDARLVVVLFLGTECPLARLYAPRLTQLATDYADKGVRFVGIDSNVQDTPAEIADYVREHAISFPVLNDQKTSWPTSSAPSARPKCSCLTRSATVRYHGRIDGQFLPGVQKTANPRRDLAIAIDELLAGKPVSEPEVEAVGCYIGRVPRAGTGGEVTYSNQIARIFQNRCVECHRAGEIGPFALTSYDEAMGWAETIREVVDQGRMPPWFADPKIGHFVNDARLSDEEKATDLRLGRRRLPRGRPERPARAAAVCRGLEHSRSRTWWSRWPSKPFQVPAEGVVDYQHFIVDPGFTEDKWMVACEARPGNRSVVHHILVFLQSPGGADRPAARVAAGRLRPGLAAAHDRSGHGQADSGRLEDHLPDALHAQRQTAAGPEHAGTQVLRCAAK